MLAWLWLLIIILVVHLSGHLVHGRLVGLRHVLMMKHVASLDLEIGRHLPVLLLHMVGFQLVNELLPLSEQLVQFQTFQGVRIEY